MSQRQQERQILNFTISTFSKNSHQNVEQIDKSIADKFRMYIFKEPGRDIKFLLKIHPKL